MRVRIPKFVSKLLDAEVNANYQGRGGRGALVSEALLFFFLHKSTSSNWLPRKKTWTKRRSRS